jgi:carbamoylphosphate synthase large subunit
MKPTLLLMSGGSLVGENVIDALGERRNELRLVATNTEAWAPSLSRVDRVLLAPPTAREPGALLDLFEQLVREESPFLAIPCRDDDVQWLAVHKEKLASWGVPAPVGSAIGAAPIADKWQSAVFSMRHGLPFAPSAPADQPSAVEDLLKQVGWPLLVKPRAGFASGGVRILSHPDQLSPVLGDPSLLVQEYLGSVDAMEEYLRDLNRLGVPLFNSFEEAKYSLQAFIGPDGALHDHVLTRHAMKQGKSAKVELWQDEELSLLLARVAAAFAAEGWRGPLNVQCQQRPDRSFAIYEYNGRFTGATSARALLGYDEVGMALATFGGLSQPLEARSQKGAFVVRSPRSSRSPWA